MVKSSPEVNPKPRLGQILDSTGRVKGALCAEVIRFEFPILKNDETLSAMLGRALRLSTASAGPSLATDAGPLSTGYPAVDHSLKLRYDLETRSCT